MFEDELSRRKEEDRKLLDAELQLNRMQHQGLEEADITNFPFTPDPVKSEEDGEKPQSSQLHQRHTEHMEAEAAGEDCGGSGPDDTTSDSSETQTNPDKHWKDPDRKRFHCSICAKKFIHRGNLNSHMRSHTGVKPFSCSLCHKSYTQRAGLNYHLKIHTGEKPFSCSVCGKMFRDKGAVTSHMAIHNLVKPFSCSVCHKRFRWTSQLKVHKCAAEHSGLHRIRKSKKPLNCSECDATFPNNYLLVTHMRTHRGKKLFTCSVCGQNRQCRSHLEIHMRTHTGEKPHSCPVCGKRFSQRGIVSQHMAVHSDLKPFSCSICSRRFFWRFQVKKHKCVHESSQQNITRFTGEDRGGPELVSSHPYGHLQLSTNNKKTELSAEPEPDIEFWKETRQHHSGFTYGRNRRISVSDGSHVAKMAFSSSDGKTGPEPKTDDRVDAGFYKQTKYPQTDPDHLRPEGSNTGVKPLGCSENRPTGEKPFSCSVCGKTFAKRDTLCSHMTCHTAEKPFSCSVCHCAFTDSESLVQHMRIHMRQTQFSCRICGEEFAWRRYLTKHMEVHKINGCSTCDQGFSLDHQLENHQCVSPQSSELHHTEENETEFDGEDCGGPGPDQGPTRSSDPGPDTDDIDDSQFGKETSDLSSLNSVKRESNGTSNRGNPTGEEVFSKRGSMDQLHSEAPLIKEEQEELWISQEGEQLQGLEEADITKFPFTPDPVKREEDEEKPQSSQLHQRLTEHTETEAARGDCGVPWSGPRPGPDIDEENEDSSEPETDDSDDWRETREPQSGLNSLSYDGMGCDSGNKALSGSDVGTSGCPEPDSDDSVDSDFWKDNHKPPSDLNSLTSEVDFKDVCESDQNSNSLRKLFRRPYSCPECGKRFLHDHDMKNHMKYHTGEKAFFCSVCGVKCLYRSHLKIHMRTHTKEKPFPCPVCGKKYAHKASMQAHMGVHSLEKRYSCSICERGFAWFTELKYHQCAGETTQEAM